MLDGGDQPGLFDELDDFGRQAGRPGIAGLHAVERAVEVDDEPALIDLVMAQDRRDVTVGGIGDGTTPGYPAKAGWDFATGWGAPDVSALVTAW